MLALTDGIYLSISLVLILVAGRHLYWSWWDLVSEYAEERLGLVNSVASQLVIRFYALCAGFVLIALPYGGEPETVREGIAMLAQKTGALMIVIVLVQTLSVRSLVVYRQFAMPDSSSRERPAV